MQSINQTCKGSICVLASFERTEGHAAALLLALCCMCDELRLCITLNNAYRATESEHTVYTCFASDLKPRQVSKLLSCERC